MAETVKSKSFYNTTIPNEWEVKKLGEIGKIRMCRRIFNHETRDKGSIPFYKIGTFGKEADAFISKELYDDYRKKFSFPKKGDILISAAGTIGRTVVYNGKPAYFQDSNIVWISNDESKILNEYLHHVYQVVRYDTEGGTIQRLYNNIINNTKFLLPPLLEQRAIAHVLSLMDSAINKNKQLITQKELHKKWLMQNLLKGRKRLKGFNREWKEYHLGDMFLERNERNNNGLTLLSIGQNGVYPQNESIKKDTSNTDKSKYKRICKGDIGYNTMRMWQGRSALSELEGIVSPAYTILKSKQNADSLFFSYMFKTPKLINLFWRNSQGLVDDTLNCKYKDFAIIKTRLPDKDEQVAVAKVLQATDKEINILKTKTEKLREQKKGMMQVLLTGKKRLKI